VNLLFLRVLLLCIQSHTDTIGRRVVRLFPQQSCFRPVKNQCYHINVAHLSIGLHYSTVRRPMNLTQLHKNKGKRPVKTAGRKLLGAGDIGVITASNADLLVAASASHSQQ